MISRLVCLVRAGSIRAELRRGGALQWAAEADWVDQAQLAEAVAELAGRAELPVWRRSVRFVLDPALVQRRVLTEVPPVSGRELAALVALAPLRYFRRGSAALVTDAGWVGPRRAGNGIAVGAEVTLVQALVRGAMEAGLVVLSIGPTPGEGEPRLSLLPDDERTRRVVIRARMTRRLLFAAALAWTALGGMAIVRDLVERRRIMARLEELREPAAAVLAAEAGADSAQRMVARLERETAREGEVVAALFRVASALPDSAFLTQLRIDSAGVGLVAGAARRPAAVLAALEGKGGVASPRFEGRTSRDQIAGRPVERFAIGFGVKERTQ